MSTRTATVIFSGGFRNSRPIRTLIPLYLLQGGLPPASEILPYLSERQQKRLNDHFCGAAAQAKVELVSHHFTPA